MSLARPASSATWTYVDGGWHEGNVAIVGPRSHVMWLASSVFDGARWFEGVAPDLDLHARRVNASAVALGLAPTMSPEEIVGLTWDGLKKFDGGTAVYIRPMYWAEDGGYMGVPADPATTRFCLCLYESPMEPPSGFSLTVSPFRRPTLETMPTNAKAACLYPNNGRIIMEAKSRGFDNALVRDMLGNVAETGSSNVFIVKDGRALTPAANEPPELTPLNPGQETPDINTDRPPTLHLPPKTTPPANTPATGKPQMTPTGSNAAKSRISPSKSPAPQAATPKPTPEATAPNN